MEEEYFIKGGLIVLGLSLPMVFILYKWNSAIGFILATIYQLIFWSIVMIDTYQRVNISASSESLSYLLYMAVVPVIASAIPFSLFRFVSKGLTKAVLIPVVLVVASFVYFGFFFLFAFGISCSNGLCL